jgi:hypothetical protein
MPKTFLHQTIEIPAPAASVWSALTQRANRAFETLVAREQALLALLQQRAAEHQSMLAQMRAAASPE